MNRTVEMNAHGTFTVSDDSHGVLAVALLIATAPQHAGRWTTALAPDGDGFAIQGVGVIRRSTSREELPAPFDEAPHFDPEVQELWTLWREHDATYPRASSWVITGDELRALVAQAVALRAAREG